MLTTDEQINTDTENMMTDSEIDRTVINKVQLSGDDNLKSRFTDFFSQNGKRAVQKKKSL